MTQSQLSLFTFSNSPDTSKYINSTEGVQPFSSQLLKWVGNKQRFAYKIISFFPQRFGTYFEPFLGSGGVLATLSPRKAIASDSFVWLIEIFKTLQNDPELLVEWYRERWDQFQNGNQKAVYEAIKSSYNKSPNAADLLFISRTCYGGVVRFRKDGYISTPIGPHKPISPEAFDRKVKEWHHRVKNTTFHCLDYEEAMSLAQPGDVVYCDPPYSDSQQILYGAQNFFLENLLGVIDKCKQRGVYVILSIDGTKKSGNKICNLPIPKGLFKQEILITVGRSMLKRFQMEDQTLEGEIVKDRLLLTY